MYSRYEMHSSWGQRKKKLLRKAQKVQKNLICELEALKYSGNSKFKTEIVEHMDNFKLQTFPKNAEPSQIRNFASFQLGRDAQSCGLNSAKKMLSTTSSSRIQTFN